MVNHRLVRNRIWLVRRRLQKAKKLSLLWRVIPFCTFWKDRACWFWEKTPAVFLLKNWPFAGFVLPKNAKNLYLKMEVAAKGQVIFPTQKRFSFCQKQGEFSQKKGICVIAIKQREHFPFTSLAARGLLWLFAVLSEVKRNNTEKQPFSPTELKYNTPLLKRQVRAIRRSDISPLKNSRERL